ncbi:MAG: NCS2 family permease [Verrucomicrobiota bacterium]|nr:NCS2 family permease [Verrucomicrobiota bacterium]
MRKEFLAGLSTFFTLAYLLLLYPQLMSEGGFDFGATLVAMILSLFVSTLFLAFYADFPAVLASGISVVSYLVFTAIPMQGVLPMQALGIVFWAGFIVFLLSAFKLRQKILRHLPPVLKFSAIGGIGLFLICIALKNLGLLSPEPALHLDHALTPATGIVAFGLLFLWLLQRRHVSSAFLFSILACWLFGLLLGLTSWKGFAAWPPSPAPSFLQLDLLAPLHPKLWTVLLSVLLISLFDSSGSLTALSRLANKIDKQGHIERLDRIVIPDGLGSMFASLLGATSQTFTLESSSGIQVGGRHGLTAIVAACACLLGLFFVPLLSSIPFFATAPALITIGFSMLLTAKEITWRNWTEALPAFITLATIPLTFSIYNGFAYGFISYAVVKTISGRYREVHTITWILALLFTAHLFL